LGVPKLIVFGWLAWSQMVGMGIMGVKLVYNNGHVIAKEIEIGSAYTTDIWLWLVDCDDYETSLCLNLSDPERWLVPHMIHAPSDISMFFRNWEAAT
jgi:hypothetical protein